MITHGRAITPQVVGENVNVKVLQLVNHHTVRQILFGSKE